MTDGFFKLGKLYQHITKDTEWPLYLPRKHDTDFDYDSQPLYSHSGHYLKVNDTFVPLDESYQDSEYIHLKLLTKDGIVCYMLILKNSTYIQIWFAQLTP